MADRETFWESSRESWTSRISLFTMSASSSVSWILEKMSRASVRRFFFTSHRGDSGRVNMLRFTMRDRSIGNRKGKRQENEFET